MNAITLKIDRFESDISLGFVTQNNGDYAEVLLNSIISLYALVKIEIIIVDNCSNDNTRDTILTYAKRLNLKIFFRNESHSLAENRNLVVENSTGKIVVLVDSDVEFIDPMFFDTVKRIFSNKEISILSPLIISKNNLTQSLGLAKLFHIPYVFKFNYPNMIPKTVRNLTRNKLFLIDMVHGACFIFRKSMFSEIGGFDEYMHPYNFDEMDFAIRAKINGYKIFASSELSIFHFGGGTTNKFNKLVRARLFTQHGIRSIIRNYCDKNLIKILITLLFLSATTYYLILETRNLFSVKIPISCLINTIKDGTNLELRKK
ncbi:MAG: glycosyltransferase family 2 protein [Thermoplasmataceae archaeon]